MICVKKALFYCLAFKLQNKDQKRVTERYMVSALADILKALEIKHWFKFLLQDRRATRHFNKEKGTGQIKVKVRIKKGILAKNKIKGNALYIRTGKFTYAKIEFLV